MYQFLFSQKETISDYYKIKVNYENKVDNDSTALPLINRFVSKAKHEKKYWKMVEGYLDGIQYSPNAHQKLKYADSAIWAAKFTRNDSILSRAYVQKGIVYYFNFKKFKPALDEYLIAYNYCDKTGDVYHKNRLAYLIAVVKNYVGYYDEALVLLKGTKRFFEAESLKKVHPNLIYGYKRGYYNSLHQMIVCYRNLGNYATADSLITLGLSLTDVSDFKQENSYFLKEKGISEFRNKDYRSSINTLRHAIVAISAVNDFAWATVCYSYIGKSYLGIGDNSEAIRYLQKVDSVFQKHNFTLPELRSSYELLINEYKQHKNTQKELYYSTQLLKANEIIAQDYPYLSSKMHKGYDTRSLANEKKQLEKDAKWGSTITIMSILLAFVAITEAIWRYRKEQDIKEKYELLEQRLLAKKDSSPEAEPIKLKDSSKLDIEIKVIEDILFKLADFEKNRGFTEKALNINKLAAKFDTNSTYLSRVINEYRGLKFTDYLQQLRIAYITDRLYNDRIFLSYKIETLADECGIASRTNFSNLFIQINGIRPSDFIKNRLKDVSDVDTSHDNDQG
ncbi:MAG: AraC family transcriptional regulator [Sphingobacteriaceae bacterium]|nr:AraC family transcriptional regulator [Sphingobacteriaceae bacterium]